MVVAVEMKVNDLELEVGDVVRIVWCCVNKNCTFCLVLMLF